MAIINSRQEEDKNELHQYMIKYIIEPVMCNEFGCGKHLTLEEGRYGNRCVQHLEKKKIDIMNLIKLK